jgi:hypothetical protein
MKNQLEQERKKGKIVGLNANTFIQRLHYYTTGNWRNKPLKSTYSGISGFREYFLNDFIIFV